MDLQPSIIQRAYDETLALVVEARDYFSALAPRQRPRDPVAELRMVREALCVTALLTDALAWLMMQRAVDAGEVTPQEACRDQHRLGRAQMRRLAAPGDGNEGDPPGLRSLIERSRQVFDRMCRLERMMLDARPV